MTTLFSVESEQSVLGALLLDPKAFDCIDWLAESDFYRDDHRLIYRHISLLLAARKPVDVVTVAEAMASAGIPEETCGLAYLGELAANTPSAANIARYAESVRDKRLLRDLMAVSAKVAEIASSQSTEPVAERIDAAQALVFELGDNTQIERRDAEPVSAILPDVVSDIQERFERGGAITGLATGFPDIDAKTFGLNPADLILIAGRPSMGKTAFALNIAEHVAINDNLPVLVFSMEMGRRQLSERSLASVGKIALGRIRTGRLLEAEDDFGRLGVAIGKLVNANLIIDDRAALSVAQMRSQCRRVARRHGLSLVVVDYIQLARGEGQSREQEVSGISRGLKAIAKEFNVPVIALSQLSRKVEERQNKRPVLSDLRESGALEQDADLVLMMYRDEYYDANSSDQGVTEVMIAKQRMGETGMVPLIFQGEYSRFESMSREAQQAMFEARRTQYKPMRRRGIE